MIIAAARAFKLSRRAASGRTLALEVRRVDAATGRTAYVKVGTGCTEYPKGAGHRLGEVIPLSTFARLEAAPSP